MSAGRAAGCPEVVGRVCIHARSYPCLKILFCRGNTMSRIRSCSYFRSGSAPLWAELTRLTLPAPPSAPQGLSRALRQADSASEAQCNINQFQQAVGDFRGCRLAGHWRCRRRSGALGRRSLDGAVFRRNGVSCAARGGARSTQLRALQARRSELVLSLARTPGLLPAALAFVEYGSSAPPPQHP